MSYECYRSNCKGHPEAGDPQVNQDAECRGSNLRIRHQWQQSSTGAEKKQSKTGRLFILGLLNSLKSLSTASHCMHQSLCCMPFTKNLVNHMSSFQPPPVSLCKCCYEASLPVLAHTPGNEHEIPPGVKSWQFDFEIPEDMVPSFDGGYQGMTWHMNGWFLKSVVNMHVHGVFFQECF